MFTGEIKRGRSKRPLVMGLIFVVIVVGLVLAMPMPHTVKSTYALEPASTEAVTAPHDGVIAEVSAADGAVVARGATIARYDATEAEQALPEQEKEVARLQQLKDSGFKPSPRAVAALKKAEAAAKAATAALDKATKAAKGKPTAALKAAEKKAAAATAALEKAQAAAGPTGAELDAQLAAAIEKLASTKALVGGANILAPASGVLSLKGLEKGATVKAEQVLGGVADTSKLRAVVAAPAGEALVKGQAVELVLADGKKKRVLFDADAKDGKAGALFDNAKGELAPGTSGVADIEGAQRSLISR